MIREFTDLDAWKKAHALTIAVYKITKEFPKDERFGLIDQLRRACVSITSNISEGFGRLTYKDKLRFYYMASGSANEVKNQIILSKDLLIINEMNYALVINQLNESQRLLNGLIRSTQRKL